MVVKTVVPKTGANSSKSGHDYAQLVMEKLNHPDALTMPYVKGLLIKALKKSRKNIHCKKLTDIKKISACKARNPQGKRDIVLVMDYADNTQTVLGISIKKGSLSSISLNNQSLENILGKYQYIDRLGYQALEKYLGHEKWHNMWTAQYGHEDRPQKCYLLQELSIEERTALITMLSDRDVFYHLLKSGFYGSDLDSADLILYPTFNESFHVEKMIVVDTLDLIDYLMKNYSANNFLKGIDPISPAKAGYRKEKHKNDSYNSIYFCDDLLHLQRKGGPKDATNLLMHIHLEQLTKTSNKMATNVSQANGGKNTYKNQRNFRNHIKEMYPTLQLEEYKVLSSPDSCELYKKDFSLWWNENITQFNFTNCDKNIVCETMKILLGCEGYSPTLAYQNNKTDKLSNAEVKKLINFKTLPFSYLSGTAKMHVSKFFADNIRIFIQTTIFHNKDYKGIIYNSIAYAKTNTLSLVVIEKEDFLNEAEKMYHTVIRNQDLKTLSIGIANVKRYGGGGKNASEKTRSNMVVAFRAGKVLCEKYAYN